MSERDDRDQLDDIVGACEQIQWFLQGLDYARFATDTRTIAAVERQLILIGEAVKGLSREVRDANPHVAWREIAGMRDVIVHAYFRLSLPEVWDAATVGVPGLWEAAVSIRADLQELP
ncbi:MAG: DUF86 domain-containing protein [Dehalococcoidia bacterium]|nr:DUF86 domain-containing protein [Dehalococcoidia bacterium]